MRRSFPSILLAAVMILLSAAMTGCNSVPTAGKEGARGFLSGKIVRGSHVRRYGLFIPTAYDPATRWPVLIFLHGIGEGSGMGEGDGKNMSVGLAPAIKQQKDSFPFIAIFPQSDGNWSPESEYVQDVVSALDDVAKKYSIDPDRVILTGLSTGGYGTYVVGAKYNRRFAALVPMASNNAAPQAAAKLTHIPVRAYCSRTGDMFAGVNDREMVSRINAAGGNAEFIETPTDGHNCWDYVYTDNDFFRWINQQQRQNPRRPAY